MKKKKPIDILFLDTSIFEANNFLEGKRINEILKLAEEGVIGIILPRLTYDEVINRVKKNIDTAYGKFKKYRNDTRVLRNIASLKDKFEIFDAGKVIKELIKEIDKRFKKAKITIVDYPIINIKEIFDGYFSQSFPFSQGKKDEFPDAFALKIVEDWSKKNKVKVKVFAKDNDIIQYDSEYLLTDDDFEKYLDLKLQEIAKEKELLLKIKNAIEEYRGKIIDDIKSWVSDELDDMYIYDEYTNDFEVYDIDISEININLEKHQITSVDDEYIALQFKTYINFKVELTIDDENYMIKDEDTKSWIYLETTNKMVDEVRYIYIDTLFYIDENEIADCEVEEINKGQKLKV